MKSLSDELKKQINNLHHAYLIVGELSESKKDIISFIEENVDSKDRESILEFDHDVFGIDSARKINQLQNRQTDKKRFFIITSKSVTVETQNSLLKMLEEPAFGNYFFWLVNNDKKILDTIKSRVITVKTKVDHSENLKDAGAFLKMNFSDREKFIGQFLGDSKKNIPADRTGSFNFISGIEMLMIQEKYPIEEIKKVVQLKSYTEDRSSNIKYILEYFLSTLKIKKK